MAEELLSIEHLSASYGEKDVLTDISLSVKAGQIICIVGESGSGKSTLLKAVHGMDRVRVTGGSIRAFGSPVSAMTDEQRRSLLGGEIGLIPQNPAGSFNPIRPFEAQLRETMQSHGRQFDPAETARAFEAVGLADARGLLRLRPYELSGGMNQRVAIAAAMLLKPRLLLCDEVTSALDVTTAGKVIRELEQMNRELGTAILMVTHHLGIARRMAEKIGIMKDGRMIELEDADWILNAPVQEYTRQLLRDVPKLAGRERSGEESAGGLDDR